MKGKDLAYVSSASPLKQKELVRNGTGAGIVKRQEEKRSENGKVNYLTSESWHCNGVLCIQTRSAKGEISRHGKRREENRAGIPEFLV